MNRGSIALKWWTRTQRIRTFAEIHIEAAILDTGAALIYQQIAPKAIRLQQVGLSESAIARKLGITDKAVAKAVAWHLRAQRHRVVNKSGKLGGFGGGLWRKQRFPAFEQGMSFSD